MADTNKIDLDALDATLVAETVEIDPDINPLEAPAPPDDGTHRAKLLLDNTTWEARETKVMKDGSRRPFLMCRFSAQIIEEGTRNNDRRVFHRVNTLVFDGKSEMAYIIRMALGDTPEARAYVKGLDNYVKLGQAFKEVLASEPVVRIATRWVAQRKITDKDGKDSYETVISGQKNFPPDGKGGYRHVISDKKTSSEVSANAVIVDFFPDEA